MKEVNAEEGTVLKTTVNGIGEWYLKRENEEWKLEDNGQETITAETSIDSDIAWKLFSKSIRKEDVKAGITISGEHSFGMKVLEMVSVMA